MKRIDVTGQRYGKLVAIKFIRIDKSHKTTWECLCDCGNTTTTRLNDLKTGRTKSCGCLLRSELTGKKFERLTVIGFSRMNKRHSYWLCKCECGITKEIRGANLTRGSTLSCGCLGLERFLAGAIKASTTHGLSNTVEYRTYKGAKKRCENVETKSYKYYGGRGIKFLYKDFKEFLTDVGLRPSLKHSLDRIDNDGNYELGNCKWSTKTEQMINRSIRKIEQFSNKIILAEVKRRGLTLQMIEQL